MTEGQPIRVRSDWTGRPPELPHDPLLAALTGPAPAAPAEPREPAAAPAAAPAKGPRVVAYRKRFGSTFALVDARHMPAQLAHAMGWTALTEVTDADRSR